MWNDNNKKIHSGGFTLLEVIIILGVFLIFFAGTLEIFRVKLRAEEKYKSRIITTYLARALMDEILTQAFEETTFGPDSGETTRLDFDDVDDYHGYGTSGEECPPLNMQGHSLDGTGNLPNYADFCREVSVEYVNETMISSGTPTDYKKVTVTATHPSIPDVVLEGVKVNTP